MPPAPRDAKAGFKKLALLHPGSPARVLVGRARRSRRARRRAPAGRRRPGGEAGGEPRRVVDRLGRPRRRRRRRACRGPGRGHRPRLLPLRPLPLRRRGGRLRAGTPRAAGAGRRRRRPRARRGRRWSSPRRPTAPATCRTCPRTSSPRRRSPPAPRRSRPPTRRSRSRSSTARRSRAKGMGGLIAVSQGSATEPRLIGLRYSGGGSGPRIGLVGKAVTFDSGGISIKPSGGMHEMKMDMSGGAAVLEAFAAIAELGLRARPRRRDPGDREHAERHRDQAGRRDHPAERQDGRGQQHRCRGTADPRRRAHVLRPRARRRAPGRRRDAHRSGGRRAGLDLRGADLQRRRLGGGGRAGGDARAASSPGACRCIPSTSSSPRGRSPTSPTPRRSARRGRSTPARSWRSSSTRFPGSTSTSPAPHGTRGASTSARAPAGSACGCWFASRATCVRS